MSASSLPVVTVEIAFATDPGATSPTWVDVSDLVELGSDGAPITITRGRTDELSEIAPSVLTLTLDNSSGDFTAENPSSTYYPNVKVGRRIRLTETYNGSTFNRFDGYVNEWPTEWVGGSTAKSTVTITASSRQAILGNGRSLKSIIEYELEAASPAFYWIFNEPSDATKASSVIPSDQVTRLNPRGTGDAYSFGNATGPGTDGYSAVEFTGGKYLGRTFTNDVIDRGTTEFTIEVAFATDSGAGTLLWLATDSDANDSHYVHLYTDGAGDLFMFTHIGGDSLGIQTSTSVVDGEVHHAAVTAINTGGTDVEFRLYVDGAQVSTTGHLLIDVISRFGFLSVGGSNGIVPLGGGNDGAAFNGSIAHLAIWPTTALSAVTIASHADAVLTGFSGERSDERISRIAGYLGIDSSFLDLEVGSAEVGTQVVDGISTVELFQQIGRTEDGLVFDGGDGSIVLHNRLHRGGTSPSVTLSVAAQEIEAGLVLKLDNTGLANDVTAKSGNDSVRVTDEASIDVHGVYERSIDVITVTDEELIQAANNALSRYSEPTTRLPELPVLVNTLSTAQATLVLGLELGDRVALSNLPDQSPAASLDFFVEGYTESIGPETYSITFNLSPASLFDRWILGSATYGVLGDTTILGL